MQIFTIFVGPPGAPAGPLQVFDVTKHMATLAWKPPKDAGGSKVTHYCVERREAGKTSWTIAASYCKDTTFTVQGLTEGRTYEFQVSACNENGQSDALTGTTPIVAKMPFSEYYHIFGKFS